MAESDRFIGGVFLVFWGVRANPDCYYFMGGQKGENLAERRIASCARWQDALTRSGAGENFLSFLLVACSFLLGYKWGYSLRISKQLPWPSLCV
jgi:hypothetical protein